MGVANSCNIEQDTCHRQYPVQYSKSTFPKIMKKHDKSALIEISQLFGTLSHVHSLRVFQNDACYRVVWQSCSQSLIRKDLSYDHHLFFKMFQIWCRFQQWNKNLRKFFSFSDRCIWIGSCKFSQYWTGYLPSAFNVFKSGP